MSRHLWFWGHSWSTPGLQGRRGRGRAWGPWVGHSEVGPLFRKAAGPDGELAGPPWKHEWGTCGPVSPPRDWLGLGELRAAYGVGGWGSPGPAGPKTLVSVGLHKMRSPRPLSCPGRMYHERPLVFLV